MAHNEIRIGARPDAVFAVLDDAEAYARWVVGTRRIRFVEDAWPAVGSRFHHAAGVVAGELLDSTKVLERRPPSRLALEVRFRPTGIARVELRITPVKQDSIVVLEETPISGFVSRLPRFVVDPLLRLRNAASLKRLRREVESRAHTPSIATADTRFRPRLAYPAAS